MRRRGPGFRLERKRRALAIVTDPEDLQPRKKLPGIVLSEDIAALSAHELELRSARLEDEIKRYKAAVQARHATKLAAENFFKR